MSRKPGWYEDPSTADRWRWWDGEAWLRWVSDDRDAPAPNGPSERVIPVLTRFDKVMRFLRLALAVALVTCLVLTGLGIYINKRDAPPAPAFIKDADGKPTLAAPQDNQRLWVDQTSIDLGGVATLPLPDPTLWEAPQTSGSLPDDGLFQEFAKVSQASHDPKVQRSRLFIGLAAEGVMSPEAGDANAGVAAVEVAKRAYEHLKGRSHAPAPATPVQVGGKNGWTATVPVSWQQEGVDHNVQVSCTTVELQPTSFLIYCHCPGGKEPKEITAGAQSTLKGLKLTDR